MYDPANPTPWVVGLLVVVLAYFLRDAHSQIKFGLEQKAAAKDLEDAKRNWDAKILAMEERHERETARLEQQYDKKFAAVVEQFQSKIESVEKNLADKLDMIMRVVDRRSPP